MIWSRANLAVLIGCLVSLHSASSTRASPVTTDKSCPVPKGSTPIELEASDGGSPVVKAYVNEKGPIHLILDNGAGNTTLNPGVARQLGLTLEKSSEQAGGLGGTVSVPLYRASVVRLGPLEKRNLVVAGVDGPVFEKHQIAGLAGVDLFDDRLMVWNLASMKVHAAPGSVTMPQANCWRKVTANWQRPWRILLSVTINGVPGQAMIDTGAQRSIVNNSYAQAMALAVDRSAGETISGIDGLPTPLALTVAPAAQVGEWRWNQMPLGVADLALFARMGPPQEHWMLLGMDWIRNRQFAINYSTQEIWQGVDQGQSR